MTTERNHVRIIKASAGSGKTYRLTQEYLAAVLDRDIPWREVLAVTFTNKATAEMKGRIVEALAAESRKDSDRGRKAAAVLEDMLHHYGDMNIGTIDSYLQGASRALEGGARVELDEEGIIAEVADRVMADATTDPKLMKRLKTLALRQVEAGKTWDVRGAVREMARRFLDEPFLLSLLEEGSVVTDPDGVERLAAMAAEQESDFIARLTAMGQDGLHKIADSGREPEQYKGKSRSPMTAFRQWAEGTVKEPSSKLQECLVETEGTPAAEAVAAALALFDAPYRDYRTAHVLSESVPTLALWSAIWRALDSVLAEGGMAMLRRSAVRLATAEEADEAYIQQRTGRKVGAMLIDEAQDTSVLQWANLRRIARETLARGGEVLAVGDVKQSIYRWRGGDWRLLGGKMQASMPEAAFDEETLVENWRSKEAVVLTNNILFGGIADRIGEVVAEQAARETAAAYADARQRRPAALEGGDPGFVHIGAIEGDAWMDEALRRSVEDIRRMHAQGYRWKDVTVLVRKNREGGDVARALLEEGIPVITEDGLQACSNACVQRAAAALRLSADDADPIARLAAGGTAHPAGATLYEAALSAVKAAEPGAEDAAYVQVLLDQAMAWQQQKGSDIAAFCRWWDDRGSHKSVGCGEGRDAVRVMTMHKSKGLSLECVVVPFAAESLSAAATLAPTIWCRAQGRFSELGLVPVKAYDKTLRGTDFEEDYGSERTLQMMDAVNALYVAMTRARSRMYVYMPKEDATKVPSRISGIVQRILGFEDDWEAGNETPVAEQAEEAAAEAAIATLGEGGAVEVTVALHADEYFGGGNTDVEF